MGARGIGHIAELCRIAPPDVAAVLNVGTAHLGEFGSPRGDRPGQGRDRRGARPRGHRRAQRRRRPGRGDARTGPPAPRAHLRRAGRRRLARRRRSTTSAGRRSRWVTTASGTPSRSASPAPTRSPTPPRPPPWPSPSASTWPTSPGPSPRRRPPRAGGWSCTSGPTAWSSSTTPTTPTRRRWRPRSTRSSRSASRRGARTVAVLGEMLELGAATAADHDEVGRYAAERGIDVVVTVGEAAAAHRGAAPPGVRAGRA